MGRTYRAFMCCAVLTVTIDCRAQIVCQDSSTSFGKATYDPATGNVVVSLDSIVPGGFLTAVGPDVPAGPVNIGSALYKAGENQASWAWFLDPPVDAFDAGQPLPPGLLQSQFDKSIYELGLNPGFWDGPCTPRVPITGGLPDPVPEPGSIALLTSGILVCIVTMRGHSY